MTDQLLQHREGGITRLTLNRPDRGNALGPDLTEALLEAFHLAAADGTRLLTLQGGGKHFCSGFDLTGFEELSDGDLTLRLIRIELLLQAIYHAPFPTMVYAHGNVFGAGADMVAACHTRMAHPETTFRMPGLGFGILLGTRRLAARIGQEKARAIQNETRQFDAAEAGAMGFVQRLATPGEWPALVEAEATAAATLAPEATAALFRATVTDTRDTDLADLVRTASPPGLRARIRAYREQVRKAAGKG